MIHFRVNVYISTPLLEYSLRRDYHILIAHNDDPTWIGRWKYQLLKIIKFSIMVYTRQRKISIWSSMKKQKQKVNKKLSLFQLHSCKPRAYLWGGVKELQPPSEISGKLQISILKCYLLKTVCSDTVIKSNTIIIGIVIVS